MPWAVRVVQEQLIDHEVSAVLTQLLKTAPKASRTEVYCIVTLAAVADRIAGFNCSLLDRMMPYLTG